MFPFAGHRNSLNEGQLDAIHQAALRLAEEVGLRVAHDGLLRRLAGQEGVRIEGQRAHFRPHLIESALGAMRFPPVPHPDRCEIICGAYTINTQDPETGEVRATTQEDLVNLTILGEQLGMVGSPAVRPLDLPEPLQELAMYKSTWEYSANRPEQLFDTTPMSTVETAETIYKMAQAIGKPFSVGMYLISPFACPPEGMNVIAAFLDRGVPMWVGSMPVAGLNAPIFLFGAHVQALAELMAGITLLYALTENKVPIFWTPIDSVRAHPFDMRSAIFVYGSAEDQVGTILQAQINARYGVPLVAKSLLSSAREPDGQAAAEKCSHTLLAALAGFRIFTNAGLLSNDDFLSPAQVVIDHEIVQYVLHIAEGIADDEQAMALAAIREAAPQGSGFIGHETTLRHFREAMWDAPLFSHVGLKASGTRLVPSLLERARAKARQLMAAGDYILPEQDRRILDRIYRDAAQRAELSL